MNDTIRNLSIDELFTNKYNYTAKSSGTILKTEIVGPVSGDVTKKEGNNTLSFVLKGILIIVTCYGVYQVMKYNVVQAKKYNQDKYEN